MTGLRKLRKSRRRVSPSEKFETVYLVHPSLADFAGTWQNELRSGAPPVKVPQKAWNTYFRSESNELFSGECFGDRPVSIHDLAKLANSGATNRVLFVGAMMWGRGPKNGRLMPKFQRVSNHSDFEKTLQQTRDLILEGKPVDAYQAWIDSGIKGIAEPFFTQWFFVCGLDSRAAVLQPLVLDSRVWKSLSKIGWSSERQTGTKYRKNPAGAYGAYLEAMAQWASELSDETVKISPLQVEQFFFRKSGKDLL